MNLSATGNTIKTIAGAVVADAIALAVAFGVNITTAQQTSLLAFVGSVTTAAVIVVGWIETHHIRAAATVAAVVKPTSLTITPPATAVAAKTAPTA